MWWRAGPDCSGYISLSNVQEYCLVCVSRHAEGRKMKNLQDEFCWYKTEEGKETGSPEERYQRIVSWAGRARGVNPDAFDEVTAWLLGGGEWGQAEMAENRAILMDGIIGRFSEQCRQLRTDLNALAPSGLVNMAVFDALDILEEELAGRTHADELKKAVNNVFTDFSTIKDTETREKFAGGITGHTGTNTVDFFGYINCLKDCDAGVQWTLFMPDLVKQQQNGFRIERFSYRKLPAMRFIGIEKDFSEDAPGLAELQYTLDAMEEYRSGFDYDAILLHHWGRGVDVENCHALWGRFMKAGAPVPEGYAYVDFCPENDKEAGMPYLSQFAFAEFSGDLDSMHNQEGFDCDAMYDVTRNTILAQKVLIPYPPKYWTAEIYLEGFQKGCTAYLFSVEK